MGAFGRPRKGWRFIPPTHDQGARSVYAPTHVPMHSISFHVLQRRDYLRLQRMTFPHETAFRRPSRIPEWTDIGEQFTEHPNMVHLPPIPAADHRKSDSTGFCRLMAEWIESFQHRLGPLPDTWPLSERDTSGG